jgi:archaeosine synthase beta-subunit
MHYRPEYPNTPAARDRFVIDLRGPRPAHDPWRYQRIAIEDEPTERGGIARVGTIFLTGRECPWRCAMCDLWRGTTRTDTPQGSIPAQIRAARQEWLDSGDVIARLKLYNASNFFDPRAVPPADYGHIADAVGEVEQVIVESHPSLIGTRVEQFLEILSGRRLEVAMGLETVHPFALDALNKRMTPDDFASAAETLRRLGVSLRVFVLIAPPFVARDEQDSWLLATVAFAEQCGASVISLIPSRGGNGTMEALTAQQLFFEPTFADVERSYALVLNRAPSPDSRARILLDPWTARAN